MSDTLARLQKIIAEHIDRPSDQILAESHFSGDHYGDQLGCDSLDMVEIVMATEEEFEIVIEDGAYAEVVQVKDLVKLVDDLVAKKG